MRLRRLRLAALMSGSTAWAFRWDVLYGSDRFPLVVGTGDLLCTAGWGSGFGGDFLCGKVHRFERPDDGRCEGDLVFEEYLSGSNGHVLNRYAGQGLHRTGGAVDAATAGHSADREGCVFHEALQLIATRLYTPWGYVVNWMARWKPERAHPVGIGLESLVGRAMRVITPRAGPARGCLSPSPTSLAPR